jgi:hypothetical protein
MSPHDVAVYFATVKTLALVHFVYFAVKAGVAQRYAQFTHGGIAGPARRLRPRDRVLDLLAVAGDGARRAGHRQADAVAVRPGFDAGYPLLFLLVGGVVARAAVGPAESLLTMSGNQNICAAVYAADAGAQHRSERGADPLFGLWGAAIATSLAMVFEAAGAVLHRLAPARHRHGRLLRARVRRSRI